MIVVSTQTSYLRGTQWLDINVPTEIDATPEEIASMDGVLIVSEASAELLHETVTRAVSPRTRNTAEKE